MDKVECLILLTLLIRPTLHLLDLGNEKKKVVDYNGVPERTISASGGSGSLQMVSEPVTGRCASLLAVPRRG